MILSGCGLVEIFCGGYEAGSKVEGSDAIPLRELSFVRLRNYGV
jgi:hypothetical protein